MSWEKVRLAKVCVKIMSGGTPSTENETFWNGNIPWVSSADIDGSFSIKPKKFLSRKAKVNILPAGNLLVVTRVGLGKVAVNDVDIAFSQDIQGLVLTDDIDKEYLVYCLLKKVERFKLVSRGATIKGVTREDLVNLQIPLPPLDSQKHIASILDKADALRQQNRQLLEHYDALLQSTFIDMFGESNSDSVLWPLFKIEDIAVKSKGSMRTGPFGSDLLHSEFTDNGVFVLGIDNVVNNRFEWDRLRYISLEKYEKLKRYTVTAGDLLISIMATVGRVAIVPEGIPLAINSKHLAAITLEKGIVEPIFVAYNLHSNPKVIRQITSGGRGAIMTGLNLGLIRKIELRVPPLILQQKFVEIYKQIESHKQQAQAALAESEALFQGLLAGYFGDH
jgi:type I restriction enzyme S subunit